MGMYAYCILYIVTVYGGIHKWGYLKIVGLYMVIMQNRIQIDDLGIPHIYGDLHISWQTLFSIYSKQLKDWTWLNYLSKVGDYMWSATFLFFLWRRHPCHRQNRLRPPAKFGPNSWWRTSFWQSSPPTLGETNGWFLHFFHFIQVWESVSKTLFLSVKTHFFWP